MPSSKTESHNVKSKIADLGERIAAPIKAALTPRDKDFFNLIESQHRDVEDLFAEFESTSKNALKTKEHLFANIASDLELHMKIEEGIFYPKLKDLEPTMALEAYEEHALVKEMIRKIAKMDAKDESYEAKVIVLKEIVEHHVREEEDELIPKMRANVDESDLEEMTEEAQAMIEGARDVSRKSSTKKSH